MYNYIYITLIIVCNLIHHSNTDKHDVDEDHKLVDASEYTPEKNCYHPIRHACWKQGEKYVNYMDTIHAP